MSPRSAPRPCSIPGCSALQSRGGYCITHFERKVKSKPQKPESKRLSRQKRGYNDSHYRLRKMIMNEQPICASDCCNKPGVELHHIDSNPWNRERDNLVMLCKSCHSFETRKTESSQLLPDVVNKPSIPVTLICGPPGSGKTSYVNEHSKAGDIVVDLDEIKSRISGLSWYQSGNKWLKPAIAERNRIIQNLYKADPEIKAWIIVSGQRLYTRRHWQKSLNAQVIVLEIAPSVCVQRIKNDPRRSDKWKEYEVIINKWYKDYVSEDTDEVVRG